MFDFAARRRRFRELCPALPAILPAARVLYRSRDTPYPFRQDSDFFYLTGFPEPEAVAYLDRDRFLLFVFPRDPEKEAWDGDRHGIEGAESFGAEGRPLGELEAFLSVELKESPRFALPLGRSPRLDAWLSGFLGTRRGASVPEIFDPDATLAEMRLLKDEEEIASLERAARITAAAHERAREELRPGMREYEVQAVIEGAFARCGGVPAYPSIVASGRNATTLHYRRNDRVIGEGDLVLIDAGCEHAMYASDVTRTHAASGELSAPQRAVFEIVAAAQREGIASCRPGRTVEDVHRAAQTVLARGLAELGVLAGDPEEMVEAGLLKPYTLHRTSHWLGLDVHDAGNSRPGGVARALAPGMVLTVEPGIYFRDGVPAPEALRGIGVRIEDDVLVTAGGPRVLSRAG